MHFLNQIISFMAWTQNDPTVFKVLIGVEVILEVAVEA